MYAKHVCWPCSGNTVTTYVWIIVGSLYSYFIWLIGESPYMWTDGIVVHMVLYTCMYVMEGSPPSLISLWFSFVLLGGALVQFPVLFDSWSCWLFEFSSKGLICWATLSLLSGPETRSLSEYSNPGTHSPRGALQMVMSDLMLLAPAEYLGSFKTGKQWSCHTTAVHTHSLWHSKEHVVEHDQTPHLRGSEIFRLTCSLWLCRLIPSMVTFGWLLSCPLIT